MAASSAACKKDLKCLAGKPYLTSVVSKNGNEFPKRFVKTSADAVDITE